MYEQRRPDVAVFIDFENVYVSVRDKLNANPNFEAIMDRCGDLGRVVISRAYADWYRYPRVTSALYANAIEPIYVATYYYDKDVGRIGRAIKNSVDMNLCIDAMKTLFTNPNIGRFVLVTGDRDFIPLVHSIRQQGKEVYIIGIGGAASTHLAQSADEFVFYEQLVGKQTTGSLVATAIASRSQELGRGLDQSLFEPHPPPPPRERERDRDREREREREREPLPVTLAPLPPPPPPPPAAQPAEPDIYTILVEAIHLVRKRGYVSTLGSIKLVMKELMGGDFKESRYRDLGGRPFAKFKDFVLDAEKRGKVQIFTNGTVNEVFLPGEDPYALSQFAAALSEEVVAEPVVDLTTITNGRKEQPRPERVASETAPPSSRRRRRRSRRGQPTTSGPEEQELLAEEVEAEEPDYTPPVDLDLLPQFVEDLPPFDEPLDEQPFISDLPVDDLMIADLPVDLETYVEPSEYDLTQHAWSDAWDAVTAASAPPQEEVWEAAVATALASEGVAPDHDAPSEPPAVEAAETDDESAEDGAIDAIEFSAEEWDIFRAMLREAAKPLSFIQISNMLRRMRKEHGVNRTNEQFRTMTKQAIHRGLIERGGRGKRVYYTLRSDEESSSSSS
jgi:uncharacterized protein (TIGR00288 family)